MDGIDLAALRRKAEAVAAVHGWWYDERQVGDYLPQVDETEHDADYIAATSPDVVLALLDRLEAAESALVRERASGR